jgi:hypothetical protein
VIALVIIPVFIVASVAMEVVAMRRCRSRIEQWATHNRFQIASVKRLWLSRGSWGIWSGAWSRRYFNIAVSDRTGSQHTGTAKIFGGFGGIAANEIEVRWQT